MRDEAHINILAPDAFGRTAVGEARSRNAFEVVRFLADCGGH